MPIADTAPSVRRHFHWCLAAVIVPVVSLPLEWAAALIHRRARASSEYRRWSRWLLALVAVDTVIAGLVIALVSSGAWGWHPLGQKPPSVGSGAPVRMGAGLSPNPDRASEPQITSVAADSPAERAGLQVGDVVIAIDGVPIRDVADAVGRIRAGEPGVARTLLIRRNGHEAQIVVTPERRDDAPMPQRAAGVAGVACSAGFLPYSLTLLRWRGLWGAAVLMLLVWLVARRVRPREPPLWSWVVAVLGGEVAVAMLALWGVCVSGWRTPEGALLAQVVHSLALLVFGMLAMQWMERRGMLGARLEPPIGAGRAVLLGFFYLAAVNLRVTIVITAVEAFAHLRVPRLPEEALLTGVADLSPLGQALVALRVVMLVPVAEEVLFRGVILPRLASWMGIAWALLATSAIFAVLHEGFTYEAIGVRAAAIFVIAMILGWARLRTGTLTAPITIHMITNAFALWANR
jgi:membrane protease YdiL (CAAX protease family)